MTTINMKNREERGLARVARRRLMAVRTCPALGPSCANELSKTHACQLLIASAWQVGESVARLDNHKH